MGKMKQLPDYAARHLALTALNQSMLVEAGAGSGKTSLMAGRVAVLLAGGVEPKNIAAITFTEFAASELLIRITKFVRQLADGGVPRDLEIAFPQGVSAEQREHFARAVKRLDQLTCTTIHGFAQALVKPYPVEARIDPGAQIIDPAEAALAFDEIYEAWIRSRLSGEANDDVVAAMVLADEKRALTLIRQIAEFAKSNRDARPVHSARSVDIAPRLGSAVRAFAAELARHGFEEEATAERARDFADLVQQVATLQLDVEKPASELLISVLLMKPPTSCFTKEGGRRKLQTKGKWETAAAATGRPKQYGAEAHGRATEKYDACHDAWQALIAQVTDEVVARAFAAMSDLTEVWRNWKREAALLDFDDLLYGARDLIRKHDQVRVALADRYRHILVDEFQDTDPLQIDLLWRLCVADAVAAGATPLDCELRPGALFLVGDPKQAIYRFRGADVNAYVRAREKIGQERVLKITANFRSVEPILTFVNRQFATPLARDGQPGFTELSIIHEASKTVAVAALDVEAGPGAKANDLRDAEAQRVAALCAHLVGNFKVRGHDNEMRPCRPGDIALLAPVGTELWRFEEALEDEGLAVSTQAGKGFFRRQEVKDLIALTRVLADGRDTMAFGALLRGPLVGLTEQAFLDISSALPVPQGQTRPPRFNLWTNVDDVEHQLAQDVLRSLQGLAMRSRSTTPYALLSDVVVALDVRAQLKQRITAGADRALANIDVFLEMARAYDVRGLRAFAADMRANWEEAVRQVEGRPDAEEQSIALITVHASKGLEWPVVIPINMTGTPQSESGLMYDRRVDRFSAPVLGVTSAAYEDIKAWHISEVEKERVRLWYVATTRARDLLVLPKHSSDLPDAAWAKIVDLDLANLPSIAPDDLGESASETAADQENAQTREIFADEAKHIVKSHHHIAWSQPSRHEADHIEPAAHRVFDTPERAEEATEERPLVRGSATRGTLLHKLMEEILNGEIEDGEAIVRERAKELLDQLGIAPADSAIQGIAPAEIAATVRRTLMLPEVAALRPRLRPELTVLGAHQADDRETIVSGIADAIASNPDGKVDVIVDWKSDVEADEQRLASYRGQLGAYLKEFGAKKGLLVLMTPGRVIEV